MKRSGKGCGCASIAQGQYNFAYRASARSRARSFRRALRRNVPVLCDPSYPFRGRPGPQSGDAKRVCRQAINPRFPAPLLPSLLSAPHARLLPQPWHPVHGLTGRSAHVLKLRQQFDRYSPFRPPRILSDRRHLDRRAKRYSVGRSVACLSAHASPPGLILHVKSGSTRVWRSSFLPVRRCSF
jgi:hypothetical protein